MEKNNLFYIYMLECSDKSLYTGYTVSVDERIKAHNSGKASKYTRARLPAKLVYVEIFDNKVDAMRRECKVKAMPRSEKLKLVMNYTKNNK